MAEQLIVKNLPFIKVLPAWAQELSYKYCSKTANLYLLSGNIRDFLPHKMKEGEFNFVKIQDYVSEVLFGNRDIIVFYDRSSGVSFCKPEMKKDYLARMRQIAPKATPGTLLSRNPVKALANLERYFYANITHNKRIVLIIDYSETVVPNTDISRYTDEDRYCLVTLNRWANDPIFTQGDVSILLLTENLADINPTIVRSPSAIKVNIPIPDERVRESFLHFLDRNDKLLLEGSLTVPEFAGITSGLNLVNLNQLAAESFQEDREITLAYLKEKKKQIIEAEAVGLLEFIESEHDLSAVSGHDFVKKRFRSAAKAIRESRFDVLPMGYLIAGPVGTGKSFMVTAFTGEIGIPIVKFRNFRSKWQGVTESNLEKILNILKAMAPVGVMIDEADAFLGDRNQDGDSGTSNRIFAQIASFMGNTEYRGKIIWFLITCRPDLLPIDLKRQGRAEEHLALFYPETDRGEGGPLHDPREEARPAHAEDERCRAVPPLQVRFLGRRPRVRAHPRQVPLRHEQPRLRDQGGPRGDDPGLHAARVPARDRAAEPRGRAGMHEPRDGPAALPRHEQGQAGQRDQAAQGAAAREGIGGPERPCTSAPRLAGALIRARVPFFSRMAVRLALAASLLVLLAISFTAGFIVRFATNELRSTVLQRNEQIARQAADEISAFVEAARRDLVATSDFIQLVSRTSWVREVLLKNHVMSAGIFESVVAIDKEGRVLADSGLEGPDLSQFPQEAVRRARAGAGWTSPVSLDSRQLPVMTLVLPVDADLALLARLPLQRIWSLIDGIEAGPGGFASLVAADGTLVAYPDKAAILRGEKPVPPRAPIAGVLLVSSPVPGLGWTVYIQQPAAEAFLPISLMLRRSLLYFLVGLTIAVLLGGAFAVLYARSLDALLLGTERIAGGDLSYMIEEKRTDEFGVLSSAFNDMVRSLRERTMALQESESRYRRVAESVWDIIYAIDAHGRFSFLNSRVEAILGRRAAEMVGQPFVDFVQPEERGRKADELRAQLTIGASSGAVGEVWAIAADGSEVLLEYTSISTKLPSGDMQVFGVARDVTARRKIEEKLRRSEKLAALGEIVSKVAHELRNAVAGITASMEMARGRGGSGALENDLDRVLCEAKRAQGIVEGLLGSSARSAVGREQCDLNEAVRSVIELRRGRWDAAGITAQVDLHGGQLPVVADSGQLRQVFHNIIDNAERALAAVPATSPREMWIRSWEGAARVCVEIADSGPGIPPAHLPKLFDPFFTTRASGEGTGLGLALSLGFVEAFGGDITARNRSSGGAVFTVDLPAVGAARAGRSPAEPAAAAGARVLVAEDEATIREFVHHFLESLGYTVDPAANGQEAVAFLATGTPYALVISDFRMPDRDGRELYDWIRASRPALLKRLIYITGDSLNPVTRLFLEESGVPYLLKPVMAPLLADLMRRVLAGGT